MAQLPQQGTHNEHLHIVSTLPSQPISRDSSGEDNENTNNSITSRRRSVISNISNTTLSIPSVNSEFYQGDFASLGPADSVSFSSVKQDTTYQEGEDTARENDTSSESSDVARKKSAKDVKSRRVLKSLMTNDENINIPNYYALLDIVAILFACLLTSVLSIVPQENAYQNPEYWYQFPLMASIGFLLSSN